MSADINSYYDVFGELYEKYSQPGKSVAPEIKLMMMVSGSLQLGQIIWNLFQVW